MFKNDEKVEETERIHLGQLFAKSRFTKLMLSYIFKLACQLGIHIYVLVHVH